MGWTSFVNEICRSADHSGAAAAATNAFAHCLRGEDLRLHLE
jgi:hypothetical protein